MPCAFKVGAQSGIITPVLRSYAKMFDRGVWFVFAAAPAGRAWENWPVA